MVNLNRSIHPLLTENIVQQLQRRNIRTIIEFVDEEPERLMTFTGHSYKDILDIKQSIYQKYGPSAKNALDVLDAELKNIVPTDISSLDVLLKGGLYPGQIYELCGITSCGKSQLCLTIATNVSLRPNNLVRYIDTKGDFCCSRVEEILKEKKCSAEVINETMERIQVCCIQNMRQLFRVLRWLMDALKAEEEALRTRIIIIDSLPAVIFKFSKDHEATYALSQLTHMCYFIAKEFKLSIISVNLITQWNSTEGNNTAASTSKNQNLITPALGKYWSRIPNTRLLIEKVGRESRKISVWKSFQLECNIACTLTISNSGMT